jgi:arylsulfatase A-like enzyme
MRRPNIVFVLTDDQGYPPLAAHGHPFLETPHLDAFHADAIRLTDCHSGTTCAPTRAGLLTGHYANSTGVWHTVGGRSLLRVGEWTLADALKGEGYATSIFGKWHLGDEYPYRPMDRGFDKSIVHGGGGIGQVPDAWGNDYFSDVYSEDGRPKQFDGYCTDVFFKEATKFIRQKAEGRNPNSILLHPRDKRATPSIQRSAHLHGPLSLANPNRIIRPLPGHDHKH